jgi:hypothetical protein
LFSEAKLSAAGSSLHATKKRERQAANAEMGICEKLGKQKFLLGGLAGVSATSQNLG